jgi:hypothetical protein
LQLLWHEFMQIGVFGSCIGEAFIILYTAWRYQDADLIYSSIQDNYTLFYITTSGDIELCTLHLSQVKYRPQ